MQFYQLATEGPLATLNNHSIFSAKAFDVQQFIKRLLVESSLLNFLFCVAFYETFISNGANHS